MFRSTVAALLLLPLLLLGLATPAAAEVTTERYATEFLHGDATECSGHTCIEYALRASTWNPKRYGGYHVCLTVTTYQDGQFVSAEHKCRETRTDRITASGKLTLTLRATHLTLDSGRAVTVAATATSNTTLHVTDRGTDVYIDENGCTVRHEFVKRDTYDHIGAHGTLTIDGSPVDMPARVGTVKHKITTRC